MGRKTTYSRENAHEHILDSGKMRTRITPHSLRNQEAIGDLLLIDDVVVEVVLVVVVVVAVVVVVEVVAGSLK
jgi:hypothetical protein